MKIKMKNLIKEIKENDQDFEFYPTTREIVSKIFFHLDDNSSILDCSNLSNLSINNLSTFCC